VSGPSDLGRQLTTGLRRIDDHTLYAEVPMSDTAEQGTLDLCLQRPGSSWSFALWYGDGLPTSCDDNPFAPAATCECLDDGSVVVWLEEKRCDEDEEVYERVRILVAFRSDGVVVTVNRYAGPEDFGVRPPWTFDELKAIALEPEWGSVS
jgi:hypothetical protein